MLQTSTQASVIIIASFFIAHWYSSLFMQSFFHHRFAAHTQFSASRFWQKIFFVFTYLTQGSSYISPRAYAIMHRMHHAHTDTKDDPHSPKYMHTLTNMMWRTRQYYQKVLSNNLKIENKYLKNLPEWKFLDSLGSSWISRIGWILGYTTFYVFFATQWWMYLILPLHFVMGPFHGVIINWFAHKIGYTNFRMKNTSTNLINFDFLMWGESLHNNHHKYPGSPNFAKKWFEFDPMYPIIILLDKLHVIQLKKVPA